MNDFSLLLPEFLVTGLAFVVLTADFFVRNEHKHYLAYLSVIGLAIILAVSLVFLWGKTDTLYGGVIRVDGYALFFKAFFLVLGGVVILSSVEYPIPEPHVVVGAAPGPPAEQDDAATHRVVRHLVSASRTR